MGLADIDREALPIIDAHIQKSRRRCLLFER
jgi:hypothetical protein